MPRKPIGPEPMDAAKRKREQRLRDKTAVIERESSEWTERQCLMVLNGGYGETMAEIAWHRLGKLKGWH